ncbi:tRNA (adenine(58)-N(1))-methyltransferase TrmI, partial [Lachnellula suecica]
NDIVVLSRSHDGETDSLLTSRLVPREAVKLRFDKIFHNHIIGKRLRDVTTSIKGRQYRITEPTLAEYTILTPRLVTPIYPQDAAVIVNLLDLNPILPGSSQGPDETLEIFEAGTGHGALTLHLARAIQAANTTPPSIPPPSTAEELENAEQEANPEQKAYTAWLQTRRAIVQTLEISRRHSKHAEGIVKNYRNGMYYPHINFHVGTIEDYLTPRLGSSPEPFFSHAILDLPKCNEYMELVAKGLKPGGSLLVFCPSVTQINTCALDAKKAGLPLFLENVVELGSSAGAGGREWDVRPVRPKAFLKAKAAEGEARKLGRETVEAVEESVGGDVAEESTASN